MIILFLIISYLLGSIPTGYLIAKIFHKKDIRTLGSGNSGATNAYRNFGHKTGLFVLICDVLKGFITVSLFCETPLMQFLVALSVISGHIWSIFTDFKGGKGVATTYGVFLALNPLLILIPLGIYIFSFSIWRISSVSSLLSILSLTISVFFIPVHFSILFLILITCPLILYTHRENIERIINDEEKKLF